MPRGSDTNPEEKSQEAVIEDSAMLATLHDLAIQNAACTGLGSVGLPPWFGTGRRGSRLLILGEGPTAFASNPRHRRSTFPLTLPSFVIDEPSGLSTGRREIAKIRRCDRYLEEGSESALR